ncbi:aldehyde dehydrogenase [Rhodococcus sp. T2V]|uniref:aldehyde dehydrogenase n=1 Tax=Rhodococcus sp. T2V TaxID=3034164 RepID=UPI0023E31E2F|nr:aldehyde dehydrogenase [Rhodococcus sp. T2V]MDF3310069.1 aldehyde dehydrogenase [Rhodococcus sp. T2V]
MTTANRSTTDTGLFADRETAFIDGEWLETTGARMLEVVDPSTEEVVHRVREASVADVQLAVRAARDAFDRGPWSTFTPDQRADVIEAILAGVSARSEDLAQVATAEIGAPISMTRNSVKFGSTYLRYYADLARTFEFAESRKRLDGSTTRVLHEPLGTVAAIIPFNGPFSMVCMKLGPALAAGCTVVLKAPPETPLAANIVGEVIDDLTRSGTIPHGVVNIVVADREASEALVADPLVDKVTFTGSTAVAKQILATAGQRIARVTAELGGKSAAIVLDDADLDQVIGPLVMGGLVNTGQACFGLTRVLVSEARRDELVEAMTARISQLVVGDAHDESTTTGPLAGARHLERVEAYVKQAVEDGATVAVGGNRPEHLDRGYFFEPTVLIDVDNASRVAQEEIFGPVISVITFRDIEDAIAIANDSVYGLGGAVFSADADRAFEIARRIRSGTVTINGFVGSHVTTPFGGYKQSGLGREGGVEGLQAFLEPKSVHLTS